MKRALAAGYAALTLALAGCGSGSGSYDSAADLHKASGLDCTYSDRDPDASEVSSGSCFGDVGAEFMILKDDKSPKDFAEASATIGSTPAAYGENWVIISTSAKDVADKLGATYVPAK